MLTRYINEIRKSRPLSQARDGLFGLDIGCGVRQDITAPFIISNRASVSTTFISARLSSHFLSFIYKIQCSILEQTLYKVLSEIFPNLLFQYNIYKVMQLCNV